MKARIVMNYGKNNTCVNFLDDEGNFCGSINNITHWDIKENSEGKGVKLTMISKDQVLSTFNLTEEPKAIHYTVSTITNLVETMLENLGNDYLYGNEEIVKVKEKEVAKYSKEVLDKVRYQLISVFSSLMSYYIKLEDVEIMPEDLLFEEDEEYRDGEEEEDENEYKKESEEEDL